MSVLLCCTLHAEVTLKDSTEAMLNVQLIGQCEYSAFVYIYFYHVIEIEQISINVTTC